MKMSIREIRAQFAAAIAAVEKGERVVITRNGEPVAELGPPSVVAPEGTIWERMDAARKAAGLDKYVGPPLDDAWLEAFNDPKFSRDALGLDDDWEPYRP
jgi:prevent-host-death family protein